MCAVLGNPAVQSMLNCLTALASVGVALATVNTLGARGKLLSLALGGGLAVNVGAISSVIVDDRLGRLVLGRLALDRLGVDGVTSVTGVDSGLETCTLARERLHELLVLAESLVHLVGRDIVKEDTAANGAGDGCAKLAITGL